jgi:hypothetical protein
LLREVVLRGNFRECIERDVRIGEQPVQGGAVNRFAALATVESEIGAGERSIEKVIEAQGFGSQCRGHSLHASVNAAASGGSRRHDTSFGPAIRSPKPRQTYHILMRVRAACCINIVFLLWVSYVPFIVDF